MKTNWVQELCECLGVATLCFLLLGVAAFVPDRSSQEVSLFAAAVVMIIVYGIGTISGAHINPVVSLSFALSRRFPRRRLVSYLCAQGVGALIALIALKLTIHPSFDWWAASPHIDSGVTFAVEAFLTAVLMFTIFSVATADCRICPDARPLAGIVVGIAVGVLSYFGSSLGVGILNPIVPFLFAVVTGTWWEFCKYVLATTLGGCVALLLFQLTRSKGNMG